MPPLKSVARPLTISGVVSVARTVPLDCPSPSKIRYFDPAVISTNSHPSGRVSVRVAVPSVCPAAFVAPVKLIPSALTFRRKITDLS